MNKDRMPLLSHLEELRKRLLFMAIAIFVGAIVCWIFYPQILDELLRPYCEIREGATSEDSLFGENCDLLVTDPLEPFSVRMMVAGYGGLVLAVPIILWQIWRFVSPGLYPKERRWVIPIVFFGILLFVVGAGLAYWSIPRALDFLVSIGGPDLVSVFSPTKYLGFIVKMIVAFGIGFEFPLILIMLQLAGMITHQTLRRGRRYAVVGIVTLVAILTPSGDPLTLVILSVPMMLFYELAILFGRLIERRRKRADSSSE